MPARKSDSPGDNLTREDIEKLIDVIHARGIEEFELEQGGTRLRIVSSHRVPAPAPALASPPPLPRPGDTPSTVAATSSTPGAAPEDDPNLKRIVSPMVGTLYRAPSPGAKPFVEIGDKVDEDTVLCIVEAMKLMNEIKAEMRGIIRKIVVENAQPVEYGQTLFLIETS